MTRKILLHILKTLPESTDDMPIVALWDGGWSNLDEWSLELDSENRVVMQFDVSDHGTYSLDKSLDVLLSDIAFFVVRPMFSKIASIHTQKSNPVLVRFGVAVSLSQNCGRVVAIRASTGFAF